MCLCSAICQWLRHVNNSEINICSFLLFYYCRCELQHLKLCLNCIVNSFNITTAPAPVRVHFSQYCVHIYGEPRWAHISRLGKIVPYTEFKYGLVIMLIILNGWWFVYNHLHMKCTLTNWSGACQHFWQLQEIAVWHPLCRLQAEQWLLN